MSSQAASAIGSLRAINSAESTYSSSCGGNGYAQTLADLYAAPAGSTAGFISPDLNANGITKSGYVVNVAGDTGAVQILAAGAACNNNTQPALSAYFAEDHPATAGSTGQRAFATDTRGTLFYTTTAAAPVNPIPSDALVVQ